MSGASVGRTVLITGASKGLGRSIALAFAAEGAALVLSARNDGPLQAVAAEIRDSGARCIALAGDVSEARDWAALVDLAEREFGGVDVLVNNAGIMGGAAALCKIDENEFDAVMATNVRGTWLGMKHVIPSMIARGGGCIVNLSSIHGLHGNAGQAAYSASKHAVIGLTKTGAIEYAKKGVRINAVCPAAHETDMYFDFRQRYTDEQWQARIDAKYPLGRAGRPEEVAGVVVFLCSAAASNLHGLAIPIDGGFAAQ